MRLEDKGWWNDTLVRFRLMYVDLCYCDEQADSLIDVRICLNKLCMYVRDSYRDAIWVAESQYIDNVIVPLLPPEVTQTTVVGSTISRSKSLSYSCLLYVLQDLVGSSHQQNMMSEEYKQACELAAREPSVGFNIFHKRLALFPLNTGNIHWTLVAVILPKDLEDMCLSLVSHVDDSISTSVEEQIKRQLEDNCGIIAFFDSLGESIVNTLKRQQLAVAIKR